MCSSIENEALEQATAIVEEIRKDVHHIITEGVLEKQLQEIIMSFYRRGENQGKLSLLRGQSQQGPWGGLGSQGGGWPWPFPGY